MVESKRCWSECLRLADSNVGRSGNFLLHLVIIFIASHASSLHKLLSLSSSLSPSLPLSLSSQSFSFRKLSTSFLSPLIPMVTKTSKTCFCSSLLFLLPFFFSSSSSFLTSLNNPSLFFTLVNLRSVL